MDNFSIECTPRLSNDNHRLFSSLHSPVCPSIEGLYHQQENVNKQPPATSNRTQPHDPPRHSPSSFLSNIFLSFLFFSFSSLPFSVSSSHPFLHLPHFFFLSFRASPHSSLTHSLTFFPSAYSTLQLSSPSRISTPKTLIYNPPLPPSLFPHHTPLQQHLFSFSLACIQDNNPLSSPLFLLTLVTVRSLSPWPRLPSLGAIEIHTYIPLPPFYLLFLSFTHSCSCLSSFFRHTRSLSYLSLSFSCILV